MRTSTHTSKPSHLRMQLMLWLIFVLVMGVLTVMLWIASAKPSLQTVGVLTPHADISKESTDFSSITYIDELDELRREVNPISFDTLVRDMRHYPEEFKDKSFFKAHKDDWTVQVMDVAEYKVITDYLEGRDDRNKFAFFRYRDENKNPRYILTYDIMSSPQHAMGAAQTIDFKLPNNVRVLPEQMSRYLAIIENYELADPVENLGLSGIRQVELSPTNQELENRQGEEEQLLESVDVNQRLDIDNNVQLNQHKAKSIEDSTDSTDTLAMSIERKAAASNQMINEATREPVSNKYKDSFILDASGNQQMNQIPNVTPKLDNTNNVVTPDNNAPSNNTGAQVDSLQQLIEDKTD